MTIPKRTSTDMLASIEQTRLKYENLEFDYDDFNELF